MEVDEAQPRGRQEIVPQDLTIGHDDPKVDAVGRELGGFLRTEPLGLAKDQPRGARPGGDGVRLDLLTASGRSVGLRVHGHDLHVRQGGGGAERGQGDLVGAEQRQPARKVRRGGRHDSRAYLRAWRAARPLRERGFSQRL